MKYIAVFQAQAWQNKYAVPVDPLGPTEWDVTEHLLSLSEFDRAAAMEADTWDSDSLRDLPNAPEWVSAWTGPFYIRVREEP